MTENENKELSKKAPFWFRAAFFARLAKHRIRAFHYFILKNIVSNQIGGVIAAFFVALLGTWQILIPLLFVDLDGKNNLEIFLFKGLCFITGLGFLIVFYLIYKFNIDEYLRRLAFKTIKNRTTLIFLFREFIKSKIKTGHKKLSLSGFLLNDLDVSFEWMQKSLGVYDKHSIKFLTGIDYFELKDLITTAYYKVIKIRKDPEKQINKKVDLEWEVRGRKETLKEQFNGFLESDEYIVFDKESFVNGKKNIFKISGILENIINQDSNHQSLLYLLISLEATLIIYRSKIALARHLELELREGLKAELIFWNHVLQARSGINLMHLVDKQCKNYLSDLLVQLKSTDNKIQDQIEKCRSEISFLLEDVKNYEEKFSKFIQINDWEPYKQDLFILVGKAFGVQKLFETIPKKERGKIRIFVVNPETPDFYPGEPMRNWLEKKKFTKSKIEKLEKIKQDIELKRYNRVCLVIGYGLMDKKENYTIHRYGVARMVNELRNTGLKNKKLALKIIMVGQSYKTIDDLHESGWAYSKINSEEIDTLITEEKVYKTIKNEDGKSSFVLIRSNN